MKKYKIVYGETIHDAVAHLKDEEDIIYEVATSKNGGRMDHEYFESKEELLKKYRGKDNGSVVKLDGFLGPFNNGRKNGKRVYRYEDKSTYYSNDSKATDAEYIKIGGKSVEVLEALPNGWRVDCDATTAPRGYVWINNNKSRFGGERKSALIREELVQNVNDAEALTKRERLKFITELTKALASPQYGYSWDEANDIAIKHADNLGEDWRARWNGDILAEVRQHLKYIKKKMDDSKVVDRQRQLLVGKNYSKYMIDRVFEQAKKYNLDVFVPEVYVDGKEEDLIEWLKSLNVSENGVDRIMRSGSL